jgi:hypothetical protein
VKPRMSNFLSVQIKTLARLCVTHAPASKLWWSPIAMCTSSLSALPAVGGSSVPCPLNTHTFYYEDFIIL